MTGVMVIQGRELSAEDIGQIQGLLAGGKIGHPYRVLVK
jgi:hypothetical protein